MDAALFEERQNLYWPYLVAMSLLVMLAFSIWLLQPDSSAYDSFMVTLIAVVGLISATGFTTMNTKVTPQELRFGFPLWEKRIPLSKIQVLGIEPMRIWYGIGVHWCGGMWVYNVHMGEGVKIDVDGRIYLIGSSDPMGLQHALMQRIRERVEV